MEELKIERRGIGMVEPKSHEKSMQFAVVEVYSCNVCNLIHIGFESVKARGERVMVRRNPYHGMGEDTIHIQNAIEDFEEHMNSKNPHNGGIVVDLKEYEEMGRPAIGDILDMELCIRRL